MTQPPSSKDNTLRADLSTAADSPCKGQALASLLDGMENQLEAVAANLYKLATMFLGDSEEAIELVESTLASPRVTGCCDAAAMAKSGRKELCAEGLRRLAAREPGCLAAPAGLEPLSSCIDDDDLNAAGLSSAQIEEMLAGPERSRLQAWLGSLPVAERAIFILRAVAGFCAPDTARMLAENGGPSAAGWAQDGVRQLLRQALCSLATQAIKTGARK